MLCIYMLANCSVLDQSYRQNNVWCNANEDVSNRNYKGFLFYCIVIYKCVTIKKYSLYIK